MKRLTLIGLLMLSLFLADAQEEFVKKIRDQYTAFNKEVEQSETGESANIPAPFKIKTVQVRPALGPVDIEIRYYFNEETKISDNENMDIRNTTGTLRKVIITESMPSFTDYREVFFDAKGNLLFYYSKLTGSTCGEKRMYFNLGKMVKIKFNPISGNDCPDENDAYKLPDFTRYPGKYTKDDLDWEKWIVKYAAQHKKAFQNLFDSLQ